MQKEEAKRYLLDLQSSLSTSVIPDYELLINRSRMVIKKIFGEHSDYSEILEEIKHLYEKDPDHMMLGSNFPKTRTRLHALLVTMLEDLEIPQNLPKELSSAAITAKSAKSNKVFVVHGRDEAMKQAVARTLEKLGLEPIILHEKPSAGRTIIEKFSDYAEVSFAVILLSPDDLGYSKEYTSKKAMFRARQNVILELGYFLGKLGRAHVTALHTPVKNFEIPSDYSGVLFIPFDDSGQWRFDLIKELQACGFDVDANKLTR